MRSFLTGAFVAVAFSIGSLAIPAGPSLADDAMKTDTMSSGPMATDPMATNTMSSEPMAADPMAADPAKADCLRKADMEQDATKKQAMVAECDAMAGGGMMSSEPMAPQQ